MRYYLIPDTNIDSIEKEDLEVKATVIFEGEQILKDRRGVAAIEGSHFTFPIDKPSLPPVPLGPNKTRDGRQVEVLALGVNQPGKETHPVITRIKQRDGTDYICRYAEDGVARNKPSSWDLVGHLPKPPREVWIWENQKGELAPNTATKIKQSGDTWKHFKEVMP